jgi:hypothetical protein
MAGIALSRLKLKPADFYDLTPKEFFAALDDHKTILEGQTRLQMEIMRMQAMINVNCHTGKKHTDPRTFMPFEWDKTEVFVPTNDDWQYLDKVFEKWQTKP